MAILKPTVVTKPKPALPSQKAKTNTLYGGNVNGEIDRTRSVINDRYMAGQDLTSQLSHYKNLTGKDYTKTGEYQGLAMNKSINDMFNQQKGYLDNLFNSQKESQLAAMRAQRDKAVGQINQQKAKVAPQYQGMRNQTDAVNQQNVQKLRELMAANGLSATGENVSANVAMNNERVNSLNSLNLQEQQTMNDYDQRIADLNNPADEMQLTAAIEAERGRAMTDAFNQAQTQGYQRYRDTIGDQRYNKEWSAQEQQRRMDNAWRTHTFNNMSASEKAQFEWAKAQFGEEQAWRMYELEYNGELAKSQSQAELDFYKSGFNNAGGGGDYSNNYKTEQQASKSGSFKTFQTHLNEAVKMGVPAQWANALTELVGRESSWNPSAKNPNSTAHGYGQFLNSTRSNYEKKTGLNYSNPVHQLVMMAQYVKDRYGTPEKALAFWDQNRWY